jgi:hypothetical protein
MLRTGAVPDPATNSALVDKAGAFLLGETPEIG